MEFCPAAVLKLLRNAWISRVTNGLVVMFVLIEIKVVVLDDIIEIR